RGSHTTPSPPRLAATRGVRPCPGLGSEGPKDGWGTPASRRWVVEEPSHKRPGGEAVLERMSEMLFVEVLRRYADALPMDHTGWLAGMRDAAGGRAPSPIHARPAGAGALGRPGRGAAPGPAPPRRAMRALIGQAPMQYLTQWRMQLAARWLRDTDAKVIDVALEVGYENEAAFARAFRRTVGQSPGAWRRAHRTRPAGGAFQATAAGAQP